MPKLEWSDTFALDVPVMDDTHQEFVDLLAAVVSASDDTLLPRWDDLVQHTDEHFAREDRWMLATGFAVDNCHSSHHKLILQIMRDGARRGRAGELAVVRQMADELGTWFPHHANSMDAGLAAHLKAIGYDTVTGTIARPAGVPAELIEGCSHSACDTEGEAVNQAGVAA